MTQPRSQSQPPQRPQPGAREQAQQSRGANRRGPRNLRRGERDAHLARVAQLYCTGRKQHEIAAELGVTQPQIAYDIKALQKRWIDASLRDFDMHKAMELAKIDALEREYWEAWRRSQQERTVTATKRVEAEVSTIEAMMKREMRDGSVVYLQGVERCISKRCELLGLNAPTKIAPTDPTGTKEYGQFSSLSTTELDREIASILERGRARATQHADPDAEV